MAKEKRQWQPREQRLVSEYLAATYPDYETRTRVRVGSVHPELKPESLEPGELRAMGVWRRWADAVVFLKTKLVLIEAKIRPSPAAIAEIELYARLLPLTPELADHRGKPIEKTLLFALEDPVIVAMARERDIKVVYFRPKWVDEYLEVLYPRERRAPKTGGL